MRRGAVRATIGVLALAGSVAGCDGMGAVFPEPDEPVFRVRPGILAFHGEPAQVIAPATAAVGKPVTVRVLTFGGGCIARKRSSTRLTASALTARIEPFDTALVFLPEGFGCTHEVTSIEHVVQLTFDRPGAATVEIAGRRLPEDQPLTVRRTITVK